MTSIKTSVTEITPDLAKTLLGKNSKNRPISAGTVTKYSKLMRQGKWHFNGETIIISDNGVLLDGQHRLSAIVSSNTTQKMIVVKGVPQDAFQTIDIGNKRTSADALATHDEKYVKNRTIIAASANTIMEFDKTGIWNENNRLHRPTHEELINFVDKNTKLLDSVQYVINLHGAKKLIPQSCLAACHYLFSAKDTYQCERFFEKLNSGEMLKINDPVLLLRNRLIEMRYSGGVFRTREVMPYLLKTWELIRKDKKVERIRIQSDYVPQVI